MKLELGAGYRPTSGYIHNDARPGKDIEIVHPAEQITDHPDVGEGRCDEVRATHLLEHFSYQDTTNVLREWWRALRPGGYLYIEVPNFSWQTGAHARGEITDLEAVNYVYGEQDYPGNFHYAGFTGQLLASKLKEADYVNVRIQDIGQVLVAWAQRPTEGQTSVS